MLIRMMTFNGRELSEGIGMEHMAKVMGDMAKANPKATVDDLKGTMIVVWPASVGAGAAVVERAGQPDEVIQAKPSRTKPALLQLPTGSVVRLVPDSPGQTGLRLITSLNSEAFKQLPDGSGPAPTLEDASEPRPGLARKKAAP